MHVAARSYLSTGVALVGAGAIALSPVAPPLPDVKVPTLSTIGVELNASVNPLQTWIEVFGTAVENLSLLGQQVAENPAPILQQVIENQLANIEFLTPAFQEFAEGFIDSLSPSNPAGIPASLVRAFEQIAAGNPAEGIPGVFQAFLLPVLYPALNVIVGAQEVITGTFVNVLDVANQAALVVASVALGAISPISSGFRALGAAAQSSAPEPEGSAPVVDESADERSPTRHPKRKLPNWKRLSRKRRPISRMRHPMRSPRTRLWSKKRATTRTIPVTTRPATATRPAGMTTPGTPGTPTRDAVN
jgi:hypothetical protein